MPFLEALTIEIPASTAEAAAVSHGVELPPGAVVDSIKLHVPDGHNAEVPVWFEAGGTRLLPSGQSGELRLNDISDLELLSAPIQTDRATTLALVGYNDDASFPHTTRAIVRGRFREEVSECETLTVI